MRAGLGVGVVVGLLFAILGFTAPQLFSPNAEVQHLACLGMVITGAALPLQSWMWAADGILIGAGDFRYLARTCALVSAIYLAALLALALGIAPHIPDTAARCALLWLGFDFILMGGRALANGLRIRTDAWMHRPSA